MANYEVRKRLENYQYTEGCPVFITGGNLVQDTDTDKIYVQLRFRSLSEREIYGISISVKCFDMDGDKLESIEKYQYLDLGIKAGETFGDRKMIPCPNEFTRKCQIKVLSVNFTDESRWERTDNAVDYVYGLQTRIEKSNHKNLMGTLYKELRNNGINANIVYVPKEYDTCWVCTCGLINKKHNEHCICGAEREKLFSIFDPEVIEGKYAAALEEEERERKRKQAEETKRRLEQQRANDEAHKNAEEVRRRLVEQEWEEQERREKQNIVFTFAVIAIIGIIVLIAISTSGDSGTVSVNGRAQSIEIAGREYMSDTMSLDLSGENLDSEDIKALKKFTNLRYLDLSDNNITDISCLSELASLRTLSLYNNNVENIEALARLNNLEELNLSCNNITDIEPLSRLVNMKELWLSYNNIRYIDAISGMNDIEVLVLDNNEIRIGSIEDLLSGKTELRELYINDNPSLYDGYRFQEEHPNLEILVDN